MPGLELDDHLARDQAQAVVMPFQQPGGGIADRCFRLRHGAVMQGQRTAFVLDKDARPLPRDRGHFRPQPPEGCRRAAIGIGIGIGARRIAPVGTTPLDAVQSCRRAAPRPKQPIEFGNRTAAYKRQSPLALTPEALQQIGQ